jgi:hypothetical protein
MSSRSCRWSVLVTRTGLVISGPGVLPSVDNASSENDVGDGGRDWVKEH